MLGSLWGEEFDIPVESEKVKTKKILNKIAEPKEIKVTVQKQIESKTISLADKLKIISEEVLRVLAKQKDNILCIKDKQTFHDYITKAIQNGRIDIDTETNNSLDPITCKLMGPCIYTPNEKQAYIPINHRDPETKERLEWQLTEQDVKEEFQRLIDHNTFTIFHNGKFDYQVIKCTCGLELPINWDTMIGAKLLDENEFNAGLKQQYISKIDPDQEKYSIDHLFRDVEYADVDPDIFAYYAATDALMTDKLYEYQMLQFKDPSMSKLFKLANEIEMPCIQVTAEMELNGIGIDQEYAKRLQNKYHSKLDKLDNELSQELNKLKPIIDAWRLTEDATKSQDKKLSAKQYANALKSKNYNASLYTNIKGEWYKVSKSKLEQFGENDLVPDDLSSPTKLGILLYDILKCPIVNKEKPYATGEEELTKLKDKQPLCSIMLKRRELVKLLTSFIDTLPNKVNEKDGRIHGTFHQYGTATGRFSSSEPNLQQVPSHNKEIRMMFCATTKYHDIESCKNENEFIVPYTDEVNTSSGWKKLGNLKLNDLIELGDHNFYKIVELTKVDEKGSLKISIDLNSIQQIPVENK